jgi:hypothetical protein
MAGNEIVSRIVFKVEGVDVLKDVFKKPKQDLLALEKEIDKLSKKKVGSIFQGQKVTSDMKLGARVAARFVRNTRREYGKAGQSGHIREIGGNIKYQDGQAQIRNAYLKKLKSNQLSSGGQSQAQYNKSMQLNLAEELNKAVRKVNDAFKKIPASLDATKQKNMIVQSMNTAYTSAVASMSKSLAGGNLNVARGHNIKAKMLNKIFDDVSKATQTVGDIKTSNSNAKSIQAKLDKANATVQKSITNIGDKALNNIAKNFSKIDVTGQTANRKKQLETSLNKAVTDATNQYTKAMSSGKMSGAKGASIINNLMKKVATITGKSSDFVGGTKSAKAMMAR